MKLKEVGRYLELPIIGTKLKAITYDGRLTLVFDDAALSYLELHGPFKVSRFNQEYQLHPGSKEALSAFHDLFHVAIQNAKCDRSGGLFLSFEDGTSVIVEDGPYENWHYTRREPLKHSEVIQVHGGVGRTTF
jgi:hypothetical protein